jgi:citrate lyase gamma subunit
MTTIDTCIKQCLSEIQSVVDKQHHDQIRKILNKTSYQLSKMFDQQLDNDIRLIVQICKVSSLSLSLTDKNKQRYEEHSR